MKLNYKRTILVGFAFFIISAFWQAYDSLVPMMLVNKFGLDQTWSGFLMTLDNFLALFMLPLFGSLSDKTKTKYGKRTPYIVVGAIVAVMTFIGLTFADNAQLANVYNNQENAVFMETLWEENDEITNLEKNLEKNVEEKDKKITVQDYMAKIYHNKNFSELNDTEKASLKTTFIELIDNSKDTYDYDRESKVYSLSPEGKTSANNIYTNVVVAARSEYAWSQTVANPTPLIVFIVVLLLILCSMATFRSPAVALMPDVTIKPLRSKGNAIINLMGAAGGIIVLVLGMIFGTGNVYNQLMSYTGMVIAVCSVMIVGLGIFIFTVKEVKWAKEMEEESIKLGIEDKVEDVDDTKEKRKLSKSEFTSLLLILASVALWYMGYNAVTSKFSLYASTVLQQDYNSTLIIAQAAAIISYIPVGIIASKIGRKKSILIGVIMLATAFISAIFVTAGSSIVFMYVIFALAGIGWATINVNSFPMVVELTKGGDVGKYTGYYYTASMAAQAITPTLSGVFMDSFGTMKVLFPYAAIFVALAFVTMFFVKHGDSVPTNADAVKTGLESFDVGD